MRLWMFLLLGLVCPLKGKAESEIADAAESGRYEELVRLLEKDKDAVDTSQPDGTTALHWAAHRGDVAMIKLLIDAGAEVEKENYFGITPLFLACQEGSAETVGLLLEAGADPNSTISGGESALMTASRTGRLRAVKLLVEAGADVNDKEKSGQNALMWAAAEGHADVVEYLIEEGADVGEKLRSGLSSWFFANRDGRIDVVKVLLKAGVDVNQVIEEGRGGRAPRKNMSALLLAVENGHFELADLLVDAGADPNDQRSGFSPLHALTWVRKPDRGDNLAGTPPPIGSGMMGALEFVRRIVAKGADVDIRLKGGSSGRGRLSHKNATPFFMAADTADLPLMKVLVELGADPKIPNADGSTVIMAAAGLGTRAPGEEAGTEPEVLEVLEYLFDLNLDIDINAVDRNGETAMHGAAYKNLPKVVNFLNQRGAEIKVWNQKNKWGWTPLLIAQGYRVGNFKPSPDTVAALEVIMLDNGITPPEPPPREARKYDY